MKTASEAAQGYLELGGVGARSMIFYTSQNCEIVIGQLPKLHLDCVQLPGTPLSKNHNPLRNTKGSKHRDKNELLMLTVECGLLLVCKHGCRKMAVARACLG